MTYFFIFLQCEKIFGDIIFRGVAFFLFINPELAMALGQITLKDMGNNMYHIEDDTYDFNVKNGEYFSNWRNFATSCAGILHGGINEPTFLLYPATYWGGEFKIHFINDVYIKP